MSSLTSYHVLYESLKTRRRKGEVLQGLDALAAHAALKVAERRHSLGRLRAEAVLIDALAPGLRSHSDAALDEVIRESRELFARGRQSTPTLRRALAAVREVARRETGEEAYLVQLIGALALYHGRIIQMLTGEGKTLTGSLAAPLLAWRHRRLHILTVNDYLAERDATGRADIYRRCGCAVGAILQSMDEPARAETYARPIVYGTPKQITADWLRDQLRMGPGTTPWSGRTTLSRSGPHAGPHSGPMIPGLHAAIVDEADAVLIDEGVVPLIIARSRQDNELAPVYRDACALAAALTEPLHYAIDHLRRRADLTRAGRERLTTSAARLPDPIWSAPRRAEELVTQALVARHCYLAGHQYQIVDGQIMIVDEYTGRFLPDRQWEHGLHQAVEAKEKLEITADRETLARMSFQRFYRTYPFLCGMTGTAADAAREMERVYQRAVLVVPSNRPVIREQYPTRVFRSQEAKWNAIVESIELIHRGTVPLTCPQVSAPPVPPTGPPVGASHPCPPTGVPPSSLFPLPSAHRPLLIGTRSIEASEFLSQRLTARGLPHRVLNANFDKDEADLIALAGKHGAITVATNMAGRGTDIKLDREARAAAAHAQAAHPASSSPLATFAPPPTAGLHVILTEMHSAKRIDRQFIGRAGRQGDPGSAQTFTSLEDELVRLHARRYATLLRATSGADELTGLARARALTLFRLAQRSAEARARSMRAEVMKQDDWIERYLPGG